MAFIQFIFYIGIIHIIFNFIWKWVFALPLSILVVVLKFDYGVRFIRLLGLYLMVSLTALFTLGAVDANLSVFSLILYPLVGAFVIFIGLAKNEYEARKEAYAGLDLDLMRISIRDANFNAYTLFGAVIFYIVALFVPSLTTNFLTLYLFKGIEWIYGIPVIGWVIAIGGVLFLISTFFYGIFTFGAIMATLFIKTKEDKDVIEEKNIELPNTDTAS